MPKGEKTKYTEKQKRQASHIEKGYKRRGLSSRTAEKRAWATVNKVHGGGNKRGGSGYGKAEHSVQARSGAKRSNKK